MKLLYNQWKHITEVLFPKLAQEYKWTIINDKDIQLFLAKLVGLDFPPPHPSRHFASTKQMKELLAICYDILDNPVLFVLMEHGIV